MIDTARPPGTVRSRLASRGADVVAVVVRELRLVLGLLLILFVTSETWRYIGRLTSFRLVLLVVTMVGVALVVVGVGLRRTLDAPVATRAAVRVAGEVLVFGVTLFVVLSALGVLSVDAALAAEWSGGRDVVLVSLGIGDPALVVTRPLLQVAAFLASLGALAFAVEVIADRDTHQALLRDLVAPPGPSR